jgi:endoglucanase
MTRLRSLLGISTAVVLAGGLSALLAMQPVQTSPPRVTQSTKAEVDVAGAPPPAGNGAIDFTRDGLSPLQDAATAEPIGVGPLHTDAGNIVDAAGRIVHISGINWFGLETSTFAPHGLWARSLDSMLDQIAQTGFNTIRLPYSDQLFEPGSTPNGIDFQKNPDLQGLSGLQIMDQVISRAGQRDLKVILDRHRPTAAAQSELWYTGSVSEQHWIEDMVMLANRYQGDPTVIGIDLHNEPHGPATWGDGNPATDWRAAAKRGGDAVLQANPDWLIFVEGIEHQGDDWYWWGGNLSLAAQFPVELSVPNKLVYEAHDYGPGVNNQKWFQAPDFPQNLAGVWNSHWAYLKLSGTAPVLIGEFGGHSVGNDPEGVWQRTLLAYLQSNGFDYTYWCWNPNSGDTGGILQNDWTTVEAAKLAVLQAYQWPMLGSPTPAFSPASVVAAYQPPAITTAPPARAPAPAPAQAPGANTFAIGGPFDPDPSHVLAGMGGPSDPDAAHRQARQADEQRYVTERGVAWPNAVYVR